MIRRRQWIFSVCFTCVLATAFFNRSGSHLKPLHNLSLSEKKALIKNQHQVQGPTQESHETNSQGIQPQFTSKATAQELKTINHLKEEVLRLSIPDAFNQQRLVAIATAPTIITTTPTTQHHNAEALIIENHGMVKVMALQVLYNHLSKSDSFEVLLKKITEQAQDETIQRVAQQVLNSHQQSRNYFADSLQALANH